MRKISGWYRLFIVFVILWTVGYATLFFYHLPTKKLIKGLRAVDIITAKTQDPPLSSEDIEKRYKDLLKTRRHYIYRFPLGWLIPIGFVYGVGWTTGWIIRGFGKEK